MKKCSKCGDVKPLSEFHKNKGNKDGLASKCKICCKEYQKKYKEDGVALIAYRKNKLKKRRLKNGKKKCVKCNKIKECNEFGKRKNNKDGLRSWCKKCRAYDTKQKRLNNPDYKEKVNKYFKSKRNSNPLFKLRCNIGKSISQSINKKGYTKKSRTYELLGCTYEEFKEYIEIQFTKGMNWDNYGKWHLDHIYPVAKAKDEEELLKLNHYTNFQPLWAKDNLSKGDKIPKGKQIKLL